RDVVAELGYRPADEDRKRACDTSILTNIRLELEHSVKIEHRHLHDAQIIDWKSPQHQLNPYDSIARIRRTDSACDPFDALAGVYPEDLREEMSGYYGLTRMLA